METTPFGKPADELAQKTNQPVYGDKTTEPSLPGLCRQAAAEGIVMLKNENGALPLTGGRPVAVLGRTQIDTFFVGYGSGGDVNAPYYVNYLDGLRAAGVLVDEALAARYGSWCAAQPRTQSEWGSWPRSFPEMELSDGDICCAAARCETALVFLGRASGESRDCALEQGSYFLTDAELSLLRRAGAAFERTVVVVNTGSVIDFSWMDGVPGLDAVVCAWQGGMESGNALADVLTGRVTPCGKLTDTIARRYEDYPSSKHFLGWDENVYEEDIFVGYRYFETFAPERVRFPFGFGLSYTTFSLEDASAEWDGADVTVHATVRNTGAASGKEVVQLYCAAPQGALGKAARSLAAFGKTGLLAPGEKQRMELRFPLASLASYDDTGATGHRSCYVLEPGEYILYAGADVRAAAPCGSVRLDELRVTRVCEEICTPAADKTFPRLVCRAEADGRLTSALEQTPAAVRSLRSRILSRMPQPLPAPQGGEVSFADVAAGCATVERFVAQLTDEELEALSRGDIVMDSPLGTKGNAGVFGGTLESLRARGVPPVTTTDGPSGVRLQQYTSLLPVGATLAATWDPALVELLYAGAGREMVMKGSDLLLAPGMNIHRDPLGGRNFEYYSEDPLLSGKMGAAVVRGIQANGVAACPKHLACNNQETNRSRNDSRVSERALREIYLRGFELCVREAKPQTIMTSYNQINGVWSHYNYDLCATLLRREWGYDGLIMTDWWMQPSQDPDFPDLSDSAYRVRAQVDVLMPGAKRVEKSDRDDSVLESLRRENGLTRAELQRAACAVLRFVLQSAAMRKTKKVL